MIRTPLWIFGGIVLGLIIHLVVILSLPALAGKDTWSRVANLDAKAQIVILDQPGIGEDNPFGLDPQLTYAICQLDLADGPGVVKGTLPDTFWSLSVFDRSGIAIYSTTNRSGIGRVLDLGIFNRAQTRLLAEQQLEIEEGLLIVEAPDNAIFITVRLAPPHLAMMPRYRAALAALSCGNLPSA